MTAVAAVLVMLGAFLLALAFPAHAWQTILAGWLVIGAICAIALGNRDPSTHVTRTGRTTR